MPPRAGPAGHPRAGQLVSGHAGNVGVGACLWDGALVLAGFLAAQPRYRYVGARCVELGGGVGLVGMALARMVRLERLGTPPTLAI